LVLKVRLKVLEDYKKVVAISMYNYDDNSNDDDDKWIESDDNWKDR